MSENEMRLPNSYCRKCDAITPTALREEKNPDYSHIPKRPQLFCVECGQKKSKRI